MKNLWRISIEPGHQNKTSSNVIGIKETWEWRSLFSMMKHRNYILQETGCLWETRIKTGKLSATKAPGFLDIIHFTDNVKSGYHIRILKTERILVIVTAFFPSSGWKNVRNKENISGVHLICGNPLILLKATQDSTSTFCCTLPWSLILIYIFLFIT